MPKITSTKFYSDLVFIYLICVKSIKKNLDNQTWTSLIDTKRKNESCARPFCSWLGCSVRNRNEKACCTTWKDQKWSPIGSKVSEHLPNSRNSYLFIFLPILFLLKQNVCIKYKKHGRSFFLYSIMNYICLVYFDLKKYT